MDDPVDKAINAPVVGCGILMIPLSCLLCGIGGTQLMAEGPHGPNGEITNDPSIAWTLPLFVGSGLVLLALAVFLLTRELNRN